MNQFLSLVNLFQAKAFRLRHRFLLILTLEFNLAIFITES